MVNIAIKYGWESLGPQKMKGLVSFTKGDFRLNIHTTTKTVTFQNIAKKYDKGLSYKDVTPEELERILIARR